MWGRVCKRDVHAHICTSTLKYLSFCTHLRAFVRVPALGAPIAPRSRPGPAFPGSSSSGVGAVSGSEAESERSPGGQWEAIPVPRLLRPRGNLGGHQEMLPGGGGIF